MADGGDSDVSAITISDDDTPHVAAAALRKAGKPALRGGAGGSTKGSKPAKSDSRRGQKGKVAFQLPSGESAGEHGGVEWDGEAEEYSDHDEELHGGNANGAVEDETKPLGWSYFRKRDTSEGPETWEEVDVEELGFVAENLVRSTTTRASQADEVIQQIFQSNPVEEDALVKDPLGRGYIDPLTLTLGKKSKLARAILPANSEKGLKATMRTFRTARLGSKQQAGAEGSEAAAGGSGAEAGASGPDEELRKVLPNQEGFDPEAYLATFHADSSMEQLRKGLRVISRELSERTGQLKELIRNNFDRFINCKDAIDDIHAKLRKMLVRGGGVGGGGRGGPSAEGPAQHQQGVGTERIIRSLEQLDTQARRTFGPILERAAKADRIRAVSNLLQRFDYLFAAPHRVLELAGRGELEQVVREYKRANLLIRPTATTARVWVSLYTEIEKRATEVYLAVKQLVSEPPPEGAPVGEDDPAASLGGAAGGAGAWLGYEGWSGRERPGQNRLSQLPDYLLFLALIRQERLPAARDEDPMRLYVSRLESHLEARIQAVDKLHTEQLGQLVTSWMKATAGGASTVGPSGTGGVLRPLASGGVAALQASLASAAPRNAPGQTSSGTDQPSGGAEAAGARGQQGAGDGASSDAGSAGEESDEDMEAAEAAFLLWQGSASSMPFSGSSTLPTHIRRELRRLVQDPGGTGAAGGDDLGPLELSAVPVSVSASARALHSGSGSAAGYLRGGGAGSGCDAVDPLPSSAHAPEPLLTAAQRQWVSYVCSVSALLLWSLPGLWATCHSPKYGSNADLDEQAKGCLERGPSLARRLVESMCAKYAARLRRAVQSLARAGPMQPGLPLVIKDACYLWSSLRRVGVGTRSLSPLRQAVMAALGAHVGVLEDHMAALPQLLFGADDFRLDVLAADTQPVTALPRRLEEEVGVVLQQYQWPLDSVVHAVGGMEEIPPDAGWRPLQGSVFACFALLSEALAEYARGLYASRGGSEDDEGSSKGSSRGKLAASLAAELEPAGAAATSSRDPLPAGGSLSTRSLGGASTAAASDTLEPGSATTGSSNDDVRMLLIISNSAMIRTRVMPRVVERYRRLLAPTADAGAACQRRLRDLTTAMRRSNEALGSSFLARKEAAVQAAVKRYIAAETAPLLAPAAEGSAAAAGRPAGSKRSAAAAAAAAGPGLLPGPSGPSAGCGAILQLLVSVHNEALTYSPSNLTSFMEALAEHLVDQLVRAYHALATPSSAAAAAAAAGSAAPAAAAAGSKAPVSSRAAHGGAASVEQVVQLWADLAFMSAALRPLLVGTLAADVQDAKVVLGGAIALRQRSRRYRPASVPAAAVAGLEDGEGVSAALQELLGPDVEAWLRRHALNVRCFAAPAAAAAPAPEAPPSSASSAAAAPAAAAASGSAPRASGGSRLERQSGSSSATGERAARQGQGQEGSQSPPRRGWREALRSAAPMTASAAATRPGRGRQE